MINFAAEQYSDQLMTEMKPLWVQHHNEIQQIRGAVLDPNLQMYQALASAGVLRIFTARREAGLVGYQVFTITSLPHFKEIKQAVMDILFLSPDARLGWMGYYFLKYADTELQKEGINVMFRAISARKDFGKILERMGYELCDLVFMRRII